MEVEIYAESINNIIIAWLHLRQKQRYLKSFWKIVIKKSLKAFWTLNVHGKRKTAESFLNYVYSYFVPSSYYISCLSKLKLNQSQAVFFSSNLLLSLVVNVDILWVWSFQNMKNVIQFNKSRFILFYFLNTWNH